eukprot:TRINITY_DN22264_c0_g1_i1.p1 TRINITY_DN22264_c0_g1~~TRINITY_DN22264_c0_g1_i1.p1  ORF type:complete len:613 (-),score=89.58 TRINITY_DN22264_c0_g1_i1:216-1814(-)
MVVLTVMQTANTKINVCHSHGVNDGSGPKTASAREGKIVAETMPPGFKATWVANFQCLSLGWNTFGKYNEEVNGLMGLFGEDCPVFGMYCRGEIGNCTNYNPSGWHSQRSSPDVTVMDNFCSDVFVCAERIDKVSTGSCSYQCCSDSRGAAEIENMRSLTMIPVSSSTRPVGQGHMTASAGSEVLKEWVPEETTGGKEAYKKYQRSVLFETVCASSAGGVSFWMHPGGTPLAERFSQSQESSEVEVFVSHALLPDRNAPSHRLGSPILYAAHKCNDLFLGSRSIITRWLSRGKIKEGEIDDAMKALTFWVDFACVDDGNNVPKKMYIIKRHLEDFVNNANYVMCLVSTQYFSRLWCIYEFSCMCKYHEDLDTIIISNASLALFDLERDVIAESVANISVKGAQCFDKSDRTIIERKIEAEYKSVAHFELFAKFSACALCARSSIFWGVETYPRVLTIWCDCAHRCGFRKLASAFREIDVSALRATIRQDIPDLPAETKCLERMLILENKFTHEWFTRKIVPMMNAERQKAIA